MFRRYNLLCTRSVYFGATRNACFSVSFSSRSRKQFDVFSILSASRFIAACIIYNLTAFLSASRACETVKAIENPPESRELLPGPDIGTERYSALRISRFRRREGRDDRTLLCYYNSKTANIGRRAAPTPISFITLREFILLLLLLYY